MLEQSESARRVSGSSFLSGRRSRSARARAHTRMCACERFIVLKPLVESGFFSRSVPMETRRLKSGMPCPNPKQVVNGERRELEHAATKQVRFAPGKSSASASASTVTARGGGGDPAAAPAPEHALSSDTARQIGPQLKLLPLNDQIRELQTIIRDK